MVQLSRTVKPLLKTLSRQPAYDVSSNTQIKDDSDIDRSPEDTPSDSEHDAEDLDSSRDSSNQRKLLLLTPMTCVEQKCPIPAQQARKDLAKKRERDASSLLHSMSTTETFEDAYSARKTKKMYYSSQYSRSSTSSSYISGSTSQSAAVENCRKAQKKQFRLPVLKDDQLIKTSYGTGVKENELCMPSSSDSLLYNTTSPTSALRETYTSTPIDLQDTLNHQADRIEAMNDVSLASIQPTNTARCSLCNREVDVSLLENFPQGTLKRFRQKREFCILHRKKEAEARWISGNYPIIDWVNFDQRLSKFHRDVSNILEQKTSSYYRNQLEQRLTHQNIRRILSDPDSYGLQNLESGYYGKKGSRRIMEHIVVKFSANIRRIAAEDKTIMALGVPGFCQTVIVPELLVLLTIEDFNVNPETARDILRESKGLGDLLCAEEDELEEHGTTEGP